MEQNTVQLSENAIEEIKSWREYAKSGVSFEKLMIGIIKNKIVESEHSDNANEDIRCMVENFIFFNDILNSLLDSN